MKSSLLITFLFVSALSTACSQDVFEMLRKGEIETIKALVEKSPETVDLRDSEGRTLLHHAAYGGDSVNVEFLIARGAKLELKDVGKKTPLHLAALRNHANVVAALINHGAELNVQDDYQRTPLLLCARERGQAASARILLDAGADMNAVDKFNDTALSLAAWRGKRDIVDLLLEQGAAVPSSGGKWKQLVSTAASQGLARLFDRLTEKGQDLKAVPEFRENLLRNAAQGGAQEIVQKLLEMGFDPQSKDPFGWTPLHYAALDGRTDAARELIATGAPLNARTTAGQSPYNVAAERDMADMTRLLASKGADTSPAQFPLLEGDYLGMKPPGEKAEVFAPGIISSIWGIHTTAVFSPDGNEVYWAPMMTFPGEIYSRGGLLMMKRVGGRWTAPEWAPFSGPDYDDDVPFFSLDGKRIYFISMRPAPGEQARGERIWSAERTPTGWTEPKLLENTINKYNMHWEFSLDRLNNLYLSLRTEGGYGMGDIYCAKFVDGKYEEPVNLGEMINSAGPEETPFIAPDGSYLIFSRAYDLWVCFRRNDGTWSAPVNLGPEVNTPSVELCPMVSPDGKYLFFNSGRGFDMHPYWIGAKVIEKARIQAKQ